MRFARTALAAVLLVITSSTSASRAWAQETPAGEDAASAGSGDKREAKKQARERFNESTKLIQDEKYDEAIVALEAAYALDPQDFHLYNLGLANYLKGDKERSLEYYQKFLAANPRDKALVREARGFIKILERDVAAIQEARKQTQAELDKARSEAEAARKATEAEAEARRKAEAQAQAAARETAEAQRERDRWRQFALDRPSAGTGKRMIGSSLVLAGGVALGAAVFYGLDARAANDELENVTGWTVSHDWLVERADKHNQRMLIFSIAGATMVAGGATLYYLGERDARKTSVGERQVRVTPAVTPTSAGMAVLGTF